MCGIHLIWGKGANEASIQKMLEMSRHRGPDQEASYSPWPGLWVGASRLKILNTGPDADQPFWSPDGRSLLLWNGEIYNYKELRNLLVKTGINFITQSDTEVLLHWLRIFGSQGLEKIQGMFVLFFLDLGSQSILVARDKNGEKPLYYSQNQDVLVISSESRGIAEFHGSQFDKKQIEYYYFLRTPLQGKTFFKGVKEWKPERYSVIKQHSAFRWDQISLQAKGSEAPNQSVFRETLRNSIQKQFHADVPVGMMLSGGMDSSLLYAMWYRETGVSLHAYTIQLEEKYRKKYEDSTYASRLVEKFPAEHHLIPIDQKTFFDNWEDYLSCVDLPIGDSAGFLTWMIGKEAKKDVKVLVSGAGADELWGGYQRHRAFDQYLEHKNFLVKYSKLFQSFPLGRGWKKFFASLDSNPRKTFLNFSALEPVSEDLYSDYERVFNSKMPWYKQILDFDRKVYLVQDVLKIQDNALMAHGLEGRSPYLDQEMIYLWEQVGDEEQLKGKPWINTCLIELQLGWLAKRKKMGFGLPLAEWFAENGEFSKRVFSALDEFEKNYGAHFPSEMKALLADKQLAIKYHFLTLYNLFLLAEWVKLRKL